MDFFHLPKLKPDQAAATCTSVGAYTGHGPGEGQSQTVVWQRWTVGLWSLSVIEQKYNMAPWTTRKMFMRADSTFQLRLAGF